MSETGQQTVDKGVRIGGSRYLNAAPPDGFGIRMYYNATTQRTHGDIEFDAAKEGPPNCAHGGAVTTVLDEAMGAAAWFNGYAVLAVNLNVNLKLPTPLETPLTVTGWIDRVEGRKVYAAAELLLPDGRVTASSTGLFLVAFEGLTPENNPFRPIES